MLVGRVPEERLNPEAKACSAAPAGIQRPATYGDRLLRRPMHNDGAGLEVGLNLHGAHSFLVQRGMWGTAGTSRRGPVTDLRGGRNSPAFGSTSRALG